jgi:hypothetical protein
MPQIGDKTDELESPSPKVTVGKASSEVLAENPEREGLHVSNGSSTAVIYLGLGEPAVVGRGVAVVFADGGWDGKIGPLIWTGSIDAISTEEGTSLAIVEV